MFVKGSSLRSQVLLKLLPNFVDISLPTGVKNLDKFIDKRYTKDTLFTKLFKGAPIHVKSAIIYNDLLIHFNCDKKYGPIQSSEKIKWCYLKDNPLRIKSLGFKGYDDPPEIVSYIKQYIHHEKLFERALKKKISMFYEALNWPFPVEKEYTLERFF